ncbi:chorismate mutase [Gallaecimonas xiamenensis]|uniref:chorismate mutase n=1 Tax=Gallaecimonas xiamenensis 3-C-1 TaxID=745411 RepID=K2KHG2_9GAMM|nr:chorismate mutase [Gallaecimonas xiamenensis]EKE76680.1 Chorismate mutase I [Gallaecimonas xiamenensis 3-C-1]
MAELERLRQQIDEVDQALLSLLGKRLALADTLGELKGGRVFDPAREFALVESRVQGFPDLPAPVVRQFCRDWVSLCRGHQGRFCIASQSPQLAKALLGRYTQTLTTQDPFAAVFQGEADGALWLGPLPDSLKGLLVAAAFRHGQQAGFLLTADGAKGGHWQLAAQGPGEAVGDHWFLISGHQFDVWPLLSDE